MSTVVTAARPRPLRLLSTRPAWVVLFCLVASLLAYGSIHPPATNPTAARISALENIIRCPACVDESIAQSSIPASLSLRAKVVELVHAGETDQQIENFVVSKYGEAGLLSPPVRGLDAAVWIVPLLFLVGGIIALGLFFASRRRRPPGGPSAEDEALVASLLAELESKP